MAAAENCSFVIRSATSGEELVRLKAASLPPDAVTEGISVTALKNILASHLHLSRFRQRLLNDTHEILSDDAKLTPPLDLQLVKLPFLPPERERDKAFFYACIQGEVAKVERALHGPQDPNIIKYGWTVLCMTSRCGHLEVARLLLEAGADKDKFDHHGQTPLHLASYNGHLEVANLLLQSGADKDQFDHKDKTPLHLASGNGHLEVVRTLLEAGADKDKSDQKGDTPLHFASCNGRLEVVRLLLEAGADKDKSDQEGDTPLHLASYRGHLEVAKFLLEVGADKDKSNHRGKTPLHLASETHWHWASEEGDEGALEVVRLLLEVGADTGKSDQEGKTPRDLALETGHVEVVKLWRSFPAVKRQRKC